MTEQWYYRKSGETRGPLSRQQLEQLARAGEIDSATLVWRAGFSEWISLAALGAPGRSELPPAPPPPPVGPTPPPKHAMSPRTARQAPIDATRWVILAAAGFLALLAAGAIGWFARGITSAPGGSLNVAAKPADPPILPAAKVSRTISPSPRVDERPKPIATKSPTAEITTASPPQSTDVGLPRSPIIPSTSEPPATTQAPLTPPNPASPLASPPAENSSPPPLTTAGQGDAAGKSETLFQEIDVQRAPKFAILGAETIHNIQYQMLSEVHVGPPDERGIRKVDQCVKDARLIKADDLSRASFEESLRKTVGWQFSYRVNPEGEVAELKSAPADGRRAAAVEPMGATGFLLTSVMDEAGWKELAQLSFFVPDPQARGNQPWIRQMTHDFGPLGCWSGTTSFRRQGTQRGVLQFEYVHDMTYKPPDKAAGDLPFAVADARFVADVAGGTIYFDSKTGRVQAAQDRFQVRGEISTELLGQAAAIQVQEQQAITVRIFDQDPWNQNNGAPGSIRQRVP